MVLENCGGHSPYLFTAQLLFLSFLGTEGSPCFKSLSFTREGSSSQPPWGLGTAVVRHLLQISRFLLMRRSEHHAESTQVSQAGARPGSGGSSCRGLTGPLGDAGGEAAGSECRGGHRCPSGVVPAMPLRAFFLIQVPPSLIFVSQEDSLITKYSLLKFVFHSKKPEVDSVAILI